MKPEDPEQYIRELERGVSETKAKPFAAQQQFGTGSDSPPFSTPSTSQSGALGVGPDSAAPDARDSGASRTVRPPYWARRRTLAWVVTLIIMGVAGLIAVLHSGNPFGPTTVQGNLIMENSGAKDTVVCNNGNLKLDGDNNTYTVTGHCRRLEVFGSENHVIVDSADSISAFGNDNTMTYHSGAPQIFKTGNNNTVSQG